MGLLKQLCDMFDLAWEDFIYDPATTLTSLFEVANIDAKWLPLLKPMLGFTKDLSFEAAEQELRRILSRAVPFWNEKPSELGCVDHAVRMVSGNRFRVRNYFDHRMQVEQTCLTEECEDFDPMCIDFPSPCARGLTIMVGGMEDWQGPSFFEVAAGLDTPFDTPYKYRFLVIEEPAEYKMSYEIDRLTVSPTELRGYTKRGLFPSDDWIECKGSLYGAMDEYVTEIRLVDDRHGEVDFDAETVPFTAGERLRGMTSHARGSLLAVERAGDAGTFTLGRVFARFQDNEEVHGNRGGRATIKGKMRNILNRDLLNFLLEVNRPCSERYDLTYTSFLDEFTTPNDLDQWDHEGGVTVPAPGSAALVPASAKMVCNDPRAPLTDVDGDGLSDEGWLNMTARWKLVAEEDAVVDCLFNVQDAQNHYLARYDLASKIVRLVRVAAGVETVLASSTVQPYLKPGVQDVIRVDTYVRLLLGHVVTRVTLSGQEVIPWTADATPSSRGGPVGLQCSAAAGAELKMVEVNVWPTESGHRLLTGDV